MKVTIKTVAVWSLLVCSPLAWADEASSVRLTQSDGAVELVKSGAPAARPAREGDVLERGDRLVAGDKSAALLLWSNGSVLKVYGGTEITLAGVSFDLERKMETTLLDLVRGRVFVKAQVPEHLFTEFKVRMGPLDLRTQGGEFAIARQADGYTAWSLSGRLVGSVGSERVRIDDLQQATVRVGAKPAPGDVVPLDDKMRAALTKVSDDLGGSLRDETTAAPAGGKLVVKIAGTAARRGSAPFTVSFKARVSGGSGKLKSVTWDFGDGESASTADAQHTFTQGMYVVIVRVEDANGAKASAQTGISVETDCGC